MMLNSLERNVQIVVSAAELNAAIMQAMETAYTTGVLDARKVLNNEPEEFYKVDEVAKMFRVSKQTIRNWMNDGTLGMPGQFAINGVRRIPKKCVKDLQLKQEQFSQTK